MYNQQEIDERIVDILHWAENKDFFDASFVKKLEDQMSRGFDLTLKQEEALENIIERFKIYD